MRDDLLDLFLGSACAVCARPGRALCRACAAGLTGAPRVCRPTPCPHGLALPVCAGDYAGEIRVLVNAHKERQRFSLAGPLGELLALAVTALQQERCRGGEACVLVPVPSRGGVVRSRGHDPMLRVARVAAARLRSWGTPATVRSALRHDRAVADQSGLGAADRAANLHHSLTARRGTAVGASMVVVDDVLTTGSTAREAQRALEAVGLPVLGIATVAATRRRLVPRPTVPESGGALPFSVRDD